MIKFIEVLQNSPCIESGSRTSGANLEDNANIKSIRGEIQPNRHGKEVGISALNIRRRHRGDIPGSLHLHNYLHTIRHTEN